MHQPRIGHLSVPPVGLGCNSLGTWADEGTSIRIVHAALDAGATFLDTADYYGGGRSEEMLGRALADRRDRAVLATKFGLWDASPPHARAHPAFVRQSLQASLQRLDTDHVDLYQLHFPDPATPIEDTLGVLLDLVDEGLVSEIGVCNTPAEDLATWNGIASVQDEWSLLRRGIETDVVPVAAKLGLAIIPYFPLASGVLTGKYGHGEPPPESRLAKAPGLARRYLTTANLDMAARLETWARTQGRELLDLAIAWLTGQPGVATVITGASRAEQVVANVAAGRWELTVDQRAEVAAILDQPDPDDDS